MFESLEEHIKHDDNLETTRRQRWLQWLAVFVFSILIFGGLVFVVRMLE